MLDDNNEDLSFKHWFRKTVRHINISLTQAPLCQSWSNFNNVLTILGFIPDGTSIVALVERQKQRGVGYMKYRYNEPDPSLRVTKVVFVQSCKEAIPKNLVDCLKEILEIMDPRTLQRKCTFQTHITIILCYLRCCKSKTYRYRIAVIAHRILKPIYLLKICFEIVFIVNNVFRLFAQLWRPDYKWTGFNGIIIRIYLT